MQLKLFEGGKETAKTRKVVIKSFSFDSVTYQLKRVFCGRPGCRKCAFGVGHGPYWYSYRKKNGKTISKYIGKVLKEISGKNATLQMFDLIVEETEKLGEKKESVKINIFKLGKIYCFKHFFDKEIFEELSGCYNQKKYRFELGNTEERDKVIWYLKHKGFKPVLVEDLSYYIVKLDKYRKYADILKKAIGWGVKGEKRIFIMKDLVSVEEAIGKGAEKVV
jgi:hypothetical protein